LTLAAKAPPAVFNRMNATSPLHSLILCPRVEEFEIVIDELHKISKINTPSNQLFFPAEEFSDLGFVVGIGGQGKVQFALHASHAIERYSPVKTLICMGAAGALSPDIKIGDVVVGTSIIEYDYKSHLQKKAAVTHRSDPGGRLVSSPLQEHEGQNFRVHLGPIASGDEDVFDSLRKTQIFEQTKALAVAWEGAGGARAARFHKKKFSEWRGITDDATAFNSSTYHNALELSLKNLMATFLTQLV
jgi:adenosylhomocysteine nucleosidase